MTDHHLGLRKRIVVVLGMHRSGTSAITRGLQVMGVQLGDRLRPPAMNNNETGFWEDLDLNALNMEMLSVLGGDWYYLAAITQDDVEVLRDKGYFLRAANLLGQKLKDAPVFGFKDPRVAKLLPFWKEVFSCCHFNMSYVLVLRHPLSVVKSLAQRDGLATEQSYLLWLGHILAALTGSNDNKRVLVDYDRLMQSPDRELFRISKCVGCKIDPQKLQSYKDDFLDQNLRHTVYELNELSLDKTCPPIVREVYAALLDVASEKAELDDPKLQDKVARWLVEFERLRSSLLLIDKLLTQKAVVTQTVADRDEQIIDLNQAVAERGRQIIDLNQAVAERDRQIIDLNQAVAERDRQIIDLNQAVAERDRRITDFERTVAEQDGRIMEIQQTVVEKDKRIKMLRDALEGIYRSVAWNIWMKINRLLPGQVKALAVWGHRVLVKLQDIFNAQYAKRSGFFDAAWYLAENPDVAVSGMDPYEHYVRHGMAEGRQSRGSFSHNDYAEWIRCYDTLTDETRAKMRERIEAFPFRPLISVLMPVYNPKPVWLKEAIESVRGQIYPRWELCIADDASTDVAVRLILEQYAKKDPRIKVVFREQNGHISAASNSALELAGGKWVALLDHDDLLSEHALFWVAEALHRHPQVRLLYSDEDKIDRRGKRLNPYFKCDWNEDLFYSHNFMAHLGVYRTALLRDLGGFRSGREGAQDYDVALRCMEHINPSQIYHIPRILYHWRMHAESTAQSKGAKPYAILAGQKVLDEHFQRQKIRAKAEIVGCAYRVRYDLPDLPSLVSLIIPTRNGLPLIRNCIESILKKTTYPYYEILIVDNGSDDIATLEYFDVLKAETRIRIVRDDRPFNYSALNNAAVKLAKGELVGLINNDLEVISSEWLSEMVSHAVRPGVGAVGARLWYPNETLQHGGVVAGVGGVAGHAHKGLPKGLTGYFGRAALLQSFSAVTAACLLIKKSIYEEVGGLNEKDLPIAFNDVDFCLRVGKAGYRNIWTPYAELYHDESSTRGLEDNHEKQERFSKEAQFMVQRWGDQLLNDPAYNPNLSLDREDFSLAWPPRITI